MANAHQEDAMVDAMVMRAKEDGQKWLLHTGSMKSLIDARENYEIEYPLESHEVERQRKHSHGKQSIKNLLKPIST